MEGKKSYGSSSASAYSSSTSITSGGYKYDGKESTNKSSSAGLFNSVFPPASLVMGRHSSKSDIFAPSMAQESYGQSQAKGKGRGYSVYESEKTDPCSLSSSLYYGGQDICSQTQNPQTYVPQTYYKKDGEDGSASSRGNWWEGSLYY